MLLSIIRPYTVCGFRVCVTVSVRNYLLFLCYYILLGLVWFKCVCVCVKEIMCFSYVLPNEGLM